MNDLIIEIFLPIIIDGEETNYLISDYGRVKNKITGQFLSCATTTDGYKFVCLYLKNRKKKYKRIHVLIAEAFIPNPENKPTVNHKDGNKSHNDVWNLEWSTHSEQNYHAYELGLMKTRKGSNSHYANVNEAIVHDICKELSLGESIPYIVKKLNVSRSIVKHILYKHSWIDISSLYDIDINKVKKEKPPGRSKYNLNNDIIFKILDLRESGLTYSMIVHEINNVASKDIVRDICRGKAYKQEKKEYESMKLNKD